MVRRFRRGQEQYYFFLNKQIASTQQVFDDLIAQGQYYQVIPVARQKLILYFFRFFFLRPIYDLRPSFLSSSWS